MQQEAEPSEMSELRGGDAADVWSGYRHPFDFCLLYGKICARYMGSSFIVLLPLTVCEASDH